MRLPYSRVSTAHCILYRSANTLWVIDLLSANGTILAGRPVDAAEWSAGSALMLGDILITYDLPASDEEPALDEEPDERHPPPATAGIGLPTPALAADASSDSVTQRLTDLSGPRSPARQRSEVVSAEPETRPAEPPRQREEHDAQWEELRRQREAWQAECASKETELAERARRIEEEAARIAAEREAVERERATREQRQLEDRSAKQQARQAELQQQREEHDARWEELRRQREAWQAECASKETALAERARRIEEEAARIAAEREAVERERASLEQRQSQEAQPAASSPAESPGHDEDPVIPAEPKGAEATVRGAPPDVRRDIEKPLAAEAQSAHRDESVAGENGGEDGGDSRELSDRLTHRLIELHQGNVVRRRWQIAMLAVGLLMFLALVAAAAVFFTRHAERRVSEHRSAWNAEVTASHVAIATRWISRERPDGTLA